MAKKIGKCVNIDCENYKQIIEVEPGEDFVCPNPQCGQPLQEVGGKPPKKNNKGKDGDGKGGNNKMKWIIVAVIALAAAAVVLFLLLGKGDDKKTVKKAPADTTTVSTPPAAKPQEADTASKPEEHITYTHQDSVIFGLIEETEPEKKADKVEVPAGKPAAQPAKATSKPTTPAVTKNGKGRVNLGYGTYTGDLKNGKPHGYGKITYKRSTRIVPSKDFVANPGDTFEGEFRDGRISGIGYWTHDGNQTAIKP